MREYNHKKIEEKWQKEWATSGLHKAETDSQKPKCYVLDEFPYPSGDGLHTGHTRIYTASDIYARLKRMQGFNVLHPSGWDAFGLPAEQYAIKNQVHPSDSVKKNTDRYKMQMNRVGLSYDWDREINTTDPAFYKWTQWIFLKLFERGLAFESYEPINWCPSCQTGLANEDLDGDVCERCGTKVEKKPMRQWVLRITAYADRLIDDLNSLPEWPDAVKDAQRNWIGKSAGAEIEFLLTGIPGQQDGSHSVKVFTTRPDTLFGVTFLAISPELGNKWIDAGWQVEKDVRAYMLLTLERRKQETYKDNPEKTGIFTGIYAINPANDEKIPVWVVNYVLGDVGTGAIMAVPAHDERDNAFAKKYELPIISVIEPVTGTPQVNPEMRKSIVAILKNKAGELLSLNWRREGGNLFVGGGRENDEDIVACAIREIEEETGYTNITCIAQTGVIHHQYFAHSKGVARNIDAHGLLFLLNDETRTATTLEKSEEGKFTLEWLAESVARERVKDELHQTCYQLLVREQVYAGDGILANSGQFTGMNNRDGVNAITTFAKGKLVNTYKLRDWVFSRQRYWGEPIPIIHCEKDGAVPVQEKDLPVLLPEVDSYAPTGTGESPLALITEWVNVMCPVCSGPAKRETNTMPQWAGSSWYYLRFMDPHNTQALVGVAEEKYWSPVDVYVGGSEHVTRHLIYARFWHKFLYDIGVASTSEPFKRRRGVGLVLGEGGVKMSKRLGNVINPDDVIDTFGADSLRVYEMFMGPFGQAIPWSTDNLIGARRFIERIWRLSEKVGDSATVVMVDKETELMHHQTIKKVGDDIEGFAFNTAVAQLMTYLNHLEKLPSVSKKSYEELLCLLAPFAPFVTEELWRAMGHTESIHASPWPTYDNTKMISETITIGIQVNGKLRDTLIIARDTPPDEVKKLALEREAVMKWVGDSTPKKVIYISEKIVSIVL